MGEVGRSDKKVARVVGVLIVLAYSMLAAEMTESRWVVLVTDGVSGLAVVGIAVLLAPYFRRVSEGLTRVYVGLKGVEGGLMLLGGVTNMMDGYGWVRGWVYEKAHLWVFIVSGWLLYWLLYRSRLVPRGLSVWGGVAIAALLVNTVVKLVGLEVVWLEYLLILIISNEVVLAGWLITKGFGVRGKKAGKVSE